MIFEFYLCFAAGHVLLIIHLIILFINIFQGSLRSRRGINLSIDDSQFPMALTTSVSPQGTLREVDTRKQKQPSKLTTLFSPMNKVGI